MRQLLALLPMLIGQASVASPYISESVPQFMGRLVRIEMQGLQRYTRQQIIKESGLREGAAYSHRHIDFAARRLRDSGLFSEVRFEVHRHGNRLEAFFSLKEVKWGVPVSFENFIWFSDEEIVSAFAHKIPSFDGTAPSTGKVIDRIRHALQQFLVDSGHPYRVDYFPSMPLNLGRSSRPGKVLRHIFRARIPNLPICSLRFPQASVVQENELIQLAKALIGSHYSRFALDRFVKLKLLPLYRNNGYLEAEFSNPVITQASDGHCQGGVSVEVPVDEGNEYRMGQVGFSGLPEKDTRRLREKWKLETGQTYDASYVKGFRRNIPGRFRKRVQIRVDPDREARVVDVTFAFR